MKTVWVLVALAALIAAIFTIQILRNSGHAALAPRGDGELRLATYNVHYIILRQATGPWSVGDWERRREPMDLAFKAMDSDIIAFQEMESFAGRSASDVNLALDWLLEQNPGYGAAAVGPADAFPSTQPILYRTSRFELRDQGWFFFSDTPDILYSRTFNGSFPAFASWAVLHDRVENRDIRVINLHTDFRSRSNRLKSVALVAERLRPWRDAGETLIVAGDFNARHGERTLRIVEAERIAFAPVSGATYHFNRGLNLFGAIDHIGATRDLVVARPPVVLRSKFAGEWPTDHYPVIVDFRYAESPG